MSSYYATAGLASDVVFDLVTQLLPRGAARLYGLLAKRGDPYNFGAGLADSLAYFCFSGIAQLRQELNPQTANYRVPDYEIAYGLSQTTAALAGTLGPRRNQILSKMREQGASTVNNVQAIMAPLLGYSNASQLVVIEASRIGLTILHTYFNNAGASIGANSNVTQTVYVSDDGSVSDGGVQLVITLTSTNPEQLSFVLTGPTAAFGGVGNGQASVTFPAASLPAGSVTSVAFPLNDQTSVGKYITGKWSLQVNTGAATCTLVGWSIFVEGGGMRDNAGNSGLGEQMHDWGIQYNSGLGSSPNFTAAKAAAQRIEPADSTFTLVNGITAQTNTTTLCPIVCNTV